MRIVGFIIRIYHDTRSPEPFELFTDKGLKGTRDRHATVISSKLLAVLKKRNKCK